MTSHDVLNATQFSGFSGSLKKFFMGRLFGSTAEIHSVSNDAQDNLLSFFGSLKQERCRAILNGIEVERFAQADPRDLRSELELGEEYFLVGFMGRFMSQKGFNYLVDAMEILSRDGSLPRKPLVLAFGWGGFIREEQQALRERGMSESFRFLPFAANVASSIKGLDMVAMPSLWEACGLLAMEVLASGTPLVASNCIGLREVVKDTPATIIPPKDGAALAAAIKKHMEKETAPRFQEFAAEACRRFDVTHQTSGIIERYRVLTR